MAPIEPASTAMAIATAWVAKEGVGKLLGPTIDYLGDGLKDIVVKRNEAAKAIVENAVNKLGDKIEQPGQVPPKVLKTILNDATYATDSLAFEYFGGVLASSRTELGRDDRGDRFARLVDGLSTYQLRAHYLIYKTISQVFTGGGYSFSTNVSRTQMTLFIPRLQFTDGMEFAKDEIDIENTLCMHILNGLGKDGLIATGWSIGNREFLRENASYDCGDDGMIVSPTQIGSELYLWAHGLGDLENDHMLSGRMNNQFPNQPLPIKNVVPVKFSNQK